MIHSNYRQQFPSDDEDRRSRLVSPSNGDTHTLRERAASQPPRSDTSYLSSSPLLTSSGSPWSQRMAASGLNPGRPAPQAINSRSASFSAGPQGQFSSAMRDARAFASTFEDDESEALSDTYDERYFPTSRGRSYAHDLTRSRSQSLATTRPGPIGSPYQTHATPGVSWQESSLNSNPLNIPGSRYGEIKPPGSSRYGSLGTLGRSPVNIHSSSPTLGNGYSNRQTVDVSNMSPFVRDVGQILLDDGAAFRELWAGMNPPRDENGGGGSGTTSRRHSVSVVQPRRGNIVGFNAPGNDGPDEPIRPFQSSGYGRGGLMLSDDDLASDLGLLNLNQDRISSQLPPSQPSSLPIYAPLSRSPPSIDRISPYQPINLTIPSSSSPLASRQTTGSSSDSGGGSGSPSRSHYEQQLSEQHYFNSGSTPQQGQGQQAFARFIPGQGIQYIPNGNNGYQRNRTPSYSGGAIPSPISPTGNRIHPQQPAYYSQQQLQRRPSDASQPSLAELGKGVPLHAVPASWPLYIVEFKAGRTDLFYLTDLSLDVRVGDLVIVEADRGKDLGKVVNDSITLAEVEAFQKQQQARAGFDEQPNSPGGANIGPTGKKEINPKMIYGKAQQQDTHLLVSKMNDEVKALQLCQSKVRAKKLPMEVIDAEYQWDRRKLTFYFVAEKRIDFRELVRELFRLYKTRIWMASLQGPGGYEQ
jgi:hypothetical protein